MFLELKQPDIHKALVQAMKELNLKKAAAAAATNTTTSSSIHDDYNNVAQGVQRQHMHTGREYPMFASKSSFGEAYEPWSDDMACILQGSCLPGSTRYCRTLSMFGNVDLKDVMQSTAQDPFANGGKRHYHTTSRATFRPVWSLRNAHRWVGSPISMNSYGTGRYATDSSQGKEEESSSAATEQGQVSQRQRLKMAVRDYGSTVVVFHVCISLMSLGGFYLAVSSGIDVKSLLCTLGFSADVIQSKLATGTSTFVMSYAVHKVFAPVRIGITLTCTPFIVRYLRGIGLLKRPIPTK